MTLAKCVILGAALLVALSSAARAQESDAQNAANNPLTPSITVNLHDYLIPNLSGPAGAANQLLLRGLLPFKLGVPQMLRMTLPIITAPTERGTKTALGDLILLDLLFFKLGGMQFGVGPQFVLPTAGSDASGAGKWQLGAAAVGVLPQRWGLSGVLITYQHSFAGEHDRSTVSLLTLQPLVNVNLPLGVYLRSSGIWNFNLNGAGDYIPIGAGVGKVWPLGGVTLNTFVEPQLTVWRHGQGVPTWLIFLGVNSQFPIAH